MEATRAKSWSRLVDKKTLGAHYDYVVGELGAVRSTQDEGKAQHDRLLAREECAQQGKSGFTDRSRRICEGQGAREALMPAGAKFETLEATSLVDFLQVDHHAAGQISHQVSYNRRPLCGKDVAPGQAASGKVADNFNSQKVLSVLGDAVATLESMPSADEERFVTSMGRKAKPVAGAMMKHRGDQQAGPVAGDYDKLRSGAELLQRSPRHVRPASARTGVAMALEARESDPSICTNAIAQSKAKAAFADGQYSEEAHRHARAQNQQMYRFASPRQQRSSAMVQQSEKSPRGAGAPSSARRRPDLVASPRSTTPTPRSNRSCSMARALDLEAAGREAVEERHQRQQQEGAFADICRFTTESRQAQLESSRSIKSALGHMQSSGVASQLVWK